MWVQIPVKNKILILKVFGILCHSRSNQTGETSKKTALLDD